MILPDEFAVELRAAAAGRDRIIANTAGEDLAVLISVDKYERLTADRKALVEAVTDFLLAWDDPGPTIEPAHLQAISAMRHALRAVRANETVRV